MEEAKIHLSLSEIELVTNADIILTKNVIIRKIKTVLEELQFAEIEYVHENRNMNEPIFSIGPKISKGENYLGLPYLILDYPRYTNGNEFLFIRQLFWWGNFFSCTLQAGGIYKKIVDKALLNNLEKLKQKDCYAGINTDPWVHHFNADNYVPFSSIEQEKFKSILQQLNYTKVAIKWPLESIINNSGELFDAWKFLLKISALVA
ncbi:MAG TPA: hypothetical protein VFQ58_08855 [Flavisolibacter sp.]|nr:hypothetical protein [Flavisolibacter sp.]